MGIVGRDIPRIAVMEVLCFARIDATAATLTSLNGVIAVNRTPCTWSIERGNDCHLPDNGGNTPLTQRGKDRDHNIHYNHNLAADVLAPGPTHSWQAAQAVPIHHFIAADLDLRVSLRAREASEA